MHRLMTWLARLLRLAAASVVPGGGFLVGGWSAATALTLYWVDNVVGSVAMGARIFLHRRWTGVSGHRRPHMNVTVTTSGRDGVVTRTEFRSFLAEFLVSSLMFSLAHGVFLAAVLGYILERPDWEATRQGAIGVAACHALALSFDSVRLDEWPFARLKDQALRVMGRVVLIHLALPGGLLLMAWRGTPDSFFGVFVGLKLLADIGTMLPRANPDAPPRWLFTVMKRVPRQKGETFEQYWRRTRARERREEARDEQV